MQISYVTRNFIVNRLLDAHTGFNFWITQAVPDYENVPLFQLAKGTNVFLGQLTAPDIDSTSEGTHPLAIVERQVLNPSLVTPTEFSGTIMIQRRLLDRLYISEVPEDPESITDAIEDAMFEAFNRRGYYGLMVGGLTYNNE